MPKANINIQLVLEGCLRSNRECQRKLYEHFHGYGLSICLRYSRHREEAVEILNDAFLKVFSNLDKYDPDQRFETWLRRIIVNTAIDHFRARHKFPPHIELHAAADMEGDEMPMPQISPDEDVLPILQRLSPAYRMVFNLFVMEGYQHHEIAEMLGISTSASRSNLVRAKANLREMLEKKIPKAVKMN